MASILSSAAELSSQAALSTEIGSSGVGILKSSGIPATTTLSFQKYFKNNWNSIKSFPKYFQKPFSMSKLILYALIFIGLIIGCIYLYKYLNTEGFDDFSNVAQQQAKKRINLLKVSPTVNVNEDDNKLIYSQPLTFKQTAYMGNLVFDGDLGVLEQLRTGSRTFFLQIDYLENSLDKTRYGSTYTPVLVLRNNNNMLVSKNSASLKQVFSSIFNYFNNSSVPLYNNPVVLLLHFVRLPYDETDTDNYIKYIDSVTDALSVLDSVTIKGYSKASKESDLFNLDFNQFNKQVIIGTNIDTNLKNIPIQLNNKIHFRYYEIKDDPVDITDRTSSIDNVNAIIYNADYLLSITDSNEQQKFAKAHKDKFVIVKSKNDQNITPENMDFLLNTLNVNVIPYDYYSVNDSSAIQTFGLYNNSSYKLKTVF